MKKNIYSKEGRELLAKLIEAREEANLTQKQVQETLGLSQSELSKIENGQRKVDFLVLVRIAALYEKPIDFFIPKNLKN